MKKLLIALCIPAILGAQSPSKITRSTTAFGDSSLISVSDTATSKTTFVTKAVSFAQVRKALSKFAFDSVVTTKINLTGATITGSPTWSSAFTAATGQRVDSSTGAARSQVLTTPRALWGQNFDGSAAITGALTGVGDITGGATSRIFTAGTGASRTLTLQTTNVSSAAINTLVLGADSSVTPLGKFVPNSVKGIVGTATNDAANAGSVGEIITGARVTGSSLSLTSPNALTVDSISLTAGDWDVSGVVAFTPASTTSITFLNGGISTTTNTIGALGTYFAWSTAANIPTAVDEVWITPTVQISVASTTTVFLIAKATFSASTLKGYGSMRARRVR